MEWQGILSLGLAVGALLVLIFTRVAAHLVMMGVLVILSVSGVLEASEAFAGFSNHGVLTVAAMFVVAAGIHGSGGVDLLVNHVLGNPRSTRRAQMRIGMPVALLSAFLNNTPVVATMIPAVRSWAKRIDIAPSKLMIPLSYSAILGGTLTMIGTSTNLVVNGQYQELTGGDSFSLFSITAVGLPVVIVGMVFMYFVFPKSLPDRREKGIFGNLREFTLEVAIASDGPLVGRTVEEAGLRNLKRIYLAEIERQGTIIPAVSSEEPLQAGDRLVFAGDTEAISDLLRIKGIVPSTDGEPTLASERRERRLVEAVISPHSHCINQTVRDSHFRERYGAAVLAVARNGERVPGNLGTTTLKPGDSLLLEARPAFVSRQKYNKDFLLVSDLGTEPPRHQRAFLSWAILVGIVLAAAFGVLSMLNAALLGAAAMMVTGCCSAQQAQKSLDPTVLLTIASSFALGNAMYKTGVAQWLADGLLTMGLGHPLLILFSTYVVVWLLTESITNNAAAILMVPVVLEMTEKASLNPEPFMLVVMMAASASFSTPLGYQTNLMVYGPGGYKFTDFLKAGVPMSILVGTTTVAVLSLGWPLTLA
ncbi:SLC13 family permease [Gilvimarinus sp. SDUM040013]|uniref:SLC13 family permease n=1 Tax=Gilvimarinus gilvus TaxID=3058038 RepID=A0ABU4S263_9GAMM|nr:SLC13 family permease [Gilvimarinus sp. SDUM040013]MDO3385490.1 SLC13 family permease [Gilvimarinus sp. SDUM040013]MDX6851275.1 SLC13 family permease [Gilvimarinus sp. SDUM040013]